MGDALRTPGALDARIVAIVAVRSHPAVRDLTISGTHAFYVMAGKTPVLVHNSCTRCRIDPRQVKFAQDGITNKFRDTGLTIQETVDGVLSGEIDPDQIKPIRLVVKGEDIYTLDHRRLVTFQKAGLADVPYVMATPEEAERESWKFDPGDPNSIKIRGTGEIWTSPGPQEDAPPVDLPPVP